MHAISREILENFQTRLRTRQKTAFIHWLTPKLEAEGYPVHIETSRGLLCNRNIVIGNIETAKVVFGAHYDTQAVMPIPIVMTPKNLLVYICMQLPMLLIGIIIMFCTAFLLMFLTQNILSFGFGTLAGCFLFLYLFIAAVPNKHTANDNTSGVITLIESMVHMPKALREKAAFVLFDNEEYGMVGSQIFYNRHRSAMKNKLLVNFDCVSDGDNVHICFSKQAKQDNSVMDLFETAFEPTANKAVIVEKGFFLYTSDQMMFPKSAAVCALKPSRWIGPYLDRIHTKRDVVFDEQNIAVCRNGVIALVTAM